MVHFTSVVLSSQNVPHMLGPSYRTHPAMRAPLAPDSRGALASSPSRSTFVDPAPRASNASLSRPQGEFESSTWVASMRDSKSSLECHPSLENLLLGAGGRNLQPTQRQHFATVLEPWTAQPEQERHPGGLRMAHTLRRERANRQRR